MTISRFSRTFIRRKACSPAKENLIDRSLKTAVVRQPLQHRFHTRHCTADGAVDPFFGQQHSALNALGIAKILQDRLQGPVIIKVDEFIQRGDGKRGVIAGAVMGACFMHGCDQAGHLASAGRVENPLGSSIGTAFFQ